MAQFFDEEVLSINASTAVGLTASKYDHSGSSRASKATIQIGSTPAWVNFSSTTPSATNGFILNAGDRITITDFENIRNFRIISQSGSGTVYVGYES